MFPAAPESTTLQAKLLDYNPPDLAPSAKRARLSMCKAKSASEDIYSRGQRSYMAWEFGNPAYMQFSRTYILYMDKKLAVLYISNEHTHKHFYRLNFFW